MVAGQQKKRDVSIEDKINEMLYHCAYNKNVLSVCKYSTEYFVFINVWQNLKT